MGSFSRVGVLSGDYGTYKDVCSSNESIVGRMCPCMETIISVGFLAEQEAMQIIVLQGIQI